MVRLQDDVLRPQVRLRRLGVGEHFTGRVRRQPGRPGIVGVDHAGLTVPEQQRLGAAVLLHGTVEVQVVLGEVGKHAHLIAHAVHPVQGQGMGGDLHHHMGAARVPHPGEEPLELKGLRRGSLRGKGLLADHVLIGADEARLGPRRLLQNGFEQVGGGGLAVGAGDPHHGHVLRGMAEEVGPHCRQRPAGIRHLDIGDVPLRRLLAQHRRRAGLHGLFDEIVPVCGEAGHGYKQSAGPHRPGVIADVRNLQLHVRRGGQDGDSLQKFF